MKLERTLNVYDVVGDVAGMVFINALGSDDWIEGGAGSNTNLKLIKAGSGDDQVYAGTRQTLADAVAAQEVGVATGRASVYFNGPPVTSGLESRRSALAANERGFACAA